MLNIAPPPMAVCHAIVCSLGASRATSMFINYCLPNRALNEAEHFFVKSEFNRISESATEAVVSDFIMIHRFSDF
jgi:hypothetical protein